MPDRHDPSQGHPPPDPSGGYPPPDPSGGYPPPDPSGGYPPPEPSGGYPPPSGDYPSPGRLQGAPAGPAGGRPGGVLPLRPLTVGDVLDGAFRLLRARFGRVALLVAVVLGPYQLATAFAMDRLLPEMGPFGELTMDATLSDEFAARMFGFSTLSGLLGMVVYLVVGAALVWLLLREDEGRSAGTGEALRAGLGRLWTTGAATVLLGIGGMAALVVVVLLSVGVGMVAVPLGVLVGLPAGLLLLLAWMAATSLVVPTAMVEADAGPVRAAGRALSLLRRRFWPIVGISVLVALMLMLVSLAISVAFGVAAFAAGPLAWVVDGVSGTVVSIVTTPVTVFAALLIYLDARVRLEGLDLERRARRAEGAAPWGGGAPSPQPGSGGPPPPTAGGHPGAPPHGPAW